MKKDTAEALLTLSQGEYDEYAKEFSNTRQQFWKELEFLKEYAYDGARVLDVGCGNGRLVDVFENVNLQYTGIDFSKELIAIAQTERAVKGTFIHADALALPFEDDTFDAVFSIAVLHHIPSKERRMQFVSEIHRVLKPDGKCILTVWNTLQWKFLSTHVTHAVKKLCGLSQLDFGDMILPFGKEKRQRYVHSLSKRSLQKILSKNNFTNISAQEIKRKSGYANYVAVAQKMSL